MVLERLRAMEAAFGGGGERKAVGDDQEDVSLSLFFSLPPLFPLMERPRDEL